MQLKQLLTNYDQFVNDVLKEMNVDFSKDDEYLEKSRKDVWYSLLFVSEGVRLKEPTIINEYFVWCDELFDSLGFSKGTAKSLFDAMKKVFLVTLEGEERQFILDFELDLIGEPVAMNNPFEDEMKTYLGFLLSHDRAAAMEFTSELVNSDMKISDIYIYVFQGAMYEIGKLWQRREITVADEHYATIVTQLNISTLYPYIFTKSKKHHKLLATAIGSELHEMGIRMVADLFELNGWDTKYLGSNIPLKEVLAFIEKFNPDVVALSITMSIHLEQLQEAVKGIKDKYPDLKIIVGGRPFIEMPKLYKKIGADGSALDAMNAVKIGESLVT